MSQAKDYYQAIILRLCAGLCLISVCTSVCRSLSLYVSLCVCYSSLILRATTMTSDTGHSLCLRGVSVASHFVVNSTSTFTRRVPSQPHARTSTRPHDMKTAAAARVVAWLASPRFVMEVLVISFFWERENSQSVDPRQGIEVKVNVDLYSALS